MLSDSIEEDNKSEKSKNSEKSNKSEKSKKSEKSNKSEKSKNSEKSNKSEKPENSEKDFKFDVKETLIKEFNNKKYLLKVSYNKDLILFEFEEINLFPIKDEYSIYLNLEQLRKMDIYFNLLNSFEEVLNVLRNNNFFFVLNESNSYKIQIFDKIRNKFFFINIPFKCKDLKNEKNTFITYFNKLNDKVNMLENKVNDLQGIISDIYNYKNVLDKKFKEIEEFTSEFGPKFTKLYKYKADLRELIEIKDEQKIKYYDINKSEILNADEVELFVSWLENKPKKINLIFNSKKDGDLIETFYDKCLFKGPTIVFVKTTKDFRFGGYTSIKWENKDGEYFRDEKCFIFSLNKKKKYPIKKPDNAINTSSTYFAFGGGSDFLLCNYCTSNNENYVNNDGTFETTEEHELNGGEKNFTVSSYEVYELVFPKYDL